MPSNMKFIFRNKKNHWFYKQQPLNIFVPCHEIFLAILDFIEWFEINIFVATKFTYKFPPWIAEIVDINV